MKETLILLALLFLTGRIVAASRALIARIRRHKWPREQMLRSQLDQE